MSFWKCSDAERWGPNLFFCESAYLLSRKRLRGKMLHRIKYCLALVPLSCRTPEAHANWCKLIWRRRSCVCQCQLPRCPWWWTWSSIAEAWYMMKINEIYPCLYPCSFTFWSSDSPPPGWTLQKRRSSALFQKTKPQWLQKEKRKSLPCPTKSPPSSEVNWVSPSISYCVWVNIEHSNHFNTHTFGKWIAFYARMDFPA